MKRRMASAWLVTLFMVVSCVFCCPVSGDEVLSLAEINELAEINATETVRGDLDLRTIAAELKIEWPVTPPTYSFADHIEKVMAEAREKAVAKYPDSLVEDAKKEAEKRFSLIKVGDQAQIVSAKPPHRVYEGRVQAITDTFVRIGNSGQISVRDLDPDTIVRFSETRSEERKAQFVKQARERMEINRQAMVDEIFPGMLKVALTNDGYRAHNTDEKKLKVYFAQTNWYSLSDVVEERAKAEREKIYKETYKKEREELYAKYGYEYDPMSGRWRQKNRLKDFPLTGNLALDRSLLEKLRGK